ncbi:DUF488 family protein, N3 subclade [Baekduia soli]|nr:hypothetical protein [Baekduia soli]
MKRIYDPREDDDRYRVPIDHVWPRRITKERAALEAIQRRPVPRP